MLIEFKISNFKSIREEQTFSLVAKNSDKGLPEALVEPKLKGISSLKFLKGAAIFGANASGKTNVLDAMQFVASFVSKGATGSTIGDPISVIPFKLDKDSISRPSTFEVTFVVDGVRYVFGFAATQKRVLREYLVAYPKGIGQNWYERTYEETTNSYRWSTSPAFDPSKGVQEKTRENSLFLSVGPQFNHAQLIPVFSWFNNNLKFIYFSAENLLHPQLTIQGIQNPSTHAQIVRLLQCADIGITDATVNETEVPSEDLEKFVPAKFLDEIRKRNEVKNFKSIQVSLSHQTDYHDPVYLDFVREESAGTRRFFSIIGPWIDVLEHGHTLFVDEIDTSLHPMLVRELLKMLRSKTDNPRSAQVVFTTHSPLLLDAGLLRRDQVWFTEKNASGVTTLYPLTDYQPRNREALARGYMAGRYGGIPFISDGLKLGTVNE